MAHEETPVRYSSIAGSVGYPTQYAKALESQALQEHYADRDRQQMMDEFAMQKEQRAEQGRDFLYRLAIQKGQREQERLDLQEKRQAVRENYYDLRQKKQDELNDKFEEIGTALSLINPLHKEASKDLQKIQQSGTFKMLLAHPQTRVAVNDMFKDQADQVRAIRKDITDTADKQYGIKNFNPDNVKATESGEYDYTHFHGTQLSSMAKALDEKTRAEYESAPEKPGYTKYEERDEFGRPVAKFVKTEDVNKPKLEEQRIQRGDQLQALGAIQALRQEFTQTLGGFKQKDLENPTAYLDENGKPTKDPSNAAVAIWKAKGKEVARMPENERKVRIEKIGNISSSIEDYSKMALPSSLTQSNSKAKTSTQQPYEGMRVIQEGQTYEYRNGNYTPVE